MTIKEAVSALRFGIPVSGSSLVEMIDHDPLREDRPFRTIRKMHLVCSTCSGERGCSECDDTGSEIEDVGEWNEQGSKFAFDVHTLVMDLSSGDIEVSGYVLLPGSGPKARRRGRGPISLSSAFPSLL